MNLLDRYIQGYIKNMVEEGILKPRSDMWHPIGSAPKDGIFVDLWVDGDRTTDCYYMCGDWRPAFTGDGTEKICGRITHWRPLPEPPSDATP